MLPEDWQTQPDFNLQKEPKELSTAAINLTGSVKL